MRFKDRIDGAKQLIPKLGTRSRFPDTMVVGLPRGGMVTASVIAQELSLPLSFLVIKKVGAPGDPELAIGAVDARGTAFLDNTLIESLRVSKDYLSEETVVKTEEARVREALYSKNYKKPEFMGKNVILIDDGIATGTSMITAIKAARLMGAVSVSVAVPVAARGSAEKIEKEADGFSAVNIESEFISVGEFYEYFPQVEDAEVIKIFENAKNNPGNK